MAILTQANHKLYEVNDFYVYLDRLKQELASHPEYTVLLAVRDEATRELNDDSMELLHNLGIQTDLTSGHRAYSKIDYYRYSFIAVIDTNGSSIEQISKQQLVHEGKFKDGFPYSITSQGTLSGTGKASIEINGNEAGVDKRGMNLVIYDNTQHQVVDSVCFDTCYGLTCYRVP